LGLPVLVNMLRLSPLIIFGQLASATEDAGGQLLTSGSEATATRSSQAHQKAESANVLVNGSALRGLLADEFENNSKDLDLYAAGQGCSMCCSYGAQYCQGAFRGQPGTCCPNMRNCCPMGYSCNMQGMCYRPRPMPVPLPSPYVPYVPPPTLAPTWPPTLPPTVPPTIPPTWSPTPPVTNSPTSASAASTPKQSGGSPYGYGKVPVYPCVRDTGGSCSVFGCSGSRGEATCEDGKCMCKPGYCSIGGTCMNTCPSDTSGTCWIFSCSSSLGLTDCISGSCVCQPGACNIGGVCKKSSGDDNGGFSWTWLIVIVVILGALAAAWFLWKQNQQKDGEQHEPDEPLLAAEEPEG